MQQFGAHSFSLDRQKVVGATHGRAGRLTRRDEATNGAGQASGEEHGTMSLVELENRKVVSLRGSETIGENGKPAPRREAQHARHQTRRQDGDGTVAKRLLLIADHSLTIEAIRLAIRQTADFQIIGQVDGHESVSAVLEEQRPDLVLVDDMQRRKHAVARLCEVREVIPTAKAILLTGSTEDDWLAEAFDAGAEFVISKAVHPVSLGTLLREIFNGNVFHGAAGGVDENMRPASDSPLTSRELEILRLVAKGSSNGLIARELWVTEQTVKFHLSNVYRKLDVANRTEASHYAHINGLLDGAPPLRREPELAVG
jgi:DNA-binding NarL/FixJ family response regulator